MSDVEREAQRIGERIWPDPGVVLGRLGGAPVPPRPGRRGTALVAALTAAGLVAVLVTALAVRSHGTGQPSGVVASATATPSAPATATAVTTTAAPATLAATPAGIGSATATLVTPAPPTTRPTVTPTPHQETTPPATPAPPGTVTLANGDNGRTVTVRAGTSVVVQLAPDAAYIWTEPASSDSAVLTRTGGGTGTDGSASATFTATASGSATISATENPACYPQGCRPPSRLWQVSVVVTG